MKAPLILLVALLALPLPRALHPEEARTNRIAPIGRLPGHEERKTQAAAEPQAGESRALAPSEAITPPTPRTAKVSLGFVGMDFGDSLPGNTGFVPPDTHAAAGPNQIIETVNTAFSIYDRTNGTRLSGPNDLNAFFSVASTDVLSDPVVLYDELAFRFFIGVIDFGTDDPATTSNLLYAVSDDSSPTDAASFSSKYSIPLHHSGLSCNGTVEADFTRAGWNADAHVFAFNMFNLSTNCFDSVRVVVIDKSSIGGSLSYHLIDRRGSDNHSTFTLTPAVMRDSVPGDPMWFAESVFFNKIRVVKLSGTPNILTAPRFDDYDIPVATYGTPPNATQGGGGFTMDTGDTRVLNVESRGDRLVVAHTVGLSGLARARWYEFDTGTVTPTLKQQGTINQGSGVHTSYPSIAIAANGDLGLTFMQSSSKQFVSMYVTGQTLGDPPGTMQTPMLAKAGMRNYTAFDCTSSDGCRAGDYSGITVDPSASDTFCAANEYATAATSANWGTWIACFKLVPNHDLAVTAIKAPKSLAGTGPVVGAVTVTIQNRSDHVETVSDATTLGNLVQLDVQPGTVNNENCIAAGVVLDPLKTPALFSKGPKLIKIGGTLTVTFRVTYNCSSAVAKGADPDTADYTHTATVHHDALPGSLPDTHPEDDICPRGPLGLDPNPPPKGTVDKGCGAKLPSGLLGGPVVTNIVF